MKGARARAPLIVIVDDDAAIRRAIASVVESAGFASASFTQAPGHRHGSAHQSIDHRVARRPIVGEHRRRARGHVPFQSARRQREARDSHVLSRRKSATRTRSRSKEGAYSERKRWTSWMDVEPSPTAAATRFVLPERTSPTAKTPGTLVSRT